MHSKELRQRFLDFFEKRGHKIVPSSSLLPTDSSVLFTTAGMQQFSSYLAGEKDVLKDFGNRFLVSCQKCFRSNDIEDVGDDTHHTFFEMLGNWSVGQDEKGYYFKKGAIKLALDFLNDALDLKKDRFWVTIFKGENNIPRDIEALEIWQENGIPLEKIKEFDSKDNFWGPTAKTGPCGPCSEIYYDRGLKYGCGSTECQPNCPKCKRFVEIWNLVFMEYNKNEDGSYIKLPQKNVDTGIGLERLTAILQEKNSAYETDLLEPIIKEISKNSSIPYTLNPMPYRIIADHLRGAVFLIGDKILPSNLGQGYVLRRILRRAIRYGKVLELGGGFLIPLAQKIIEKYQDFYPEIKSQESNIFQVIQAEEEKFGKTLNNGLAQFEKIINSNKEKISGQEAFLLFNSYGFPIEMTEELAKENGVKVDKESFEQAFQKHQEISRAGVEKKFGGIGQELNYITTKLHTATHLLHQALREVLGKNVQQMGSDITSERLRFDFSYSQKLTEEEIQKVESLVNEKIKEDLVIEEKEMKYEGALKIGALAFFREKYPEMVKVYSVGSPSASSGQVFSKEICAGPHVKKTSELGQFKIIKEESVSAGVRRIRAILI